MKKLYLFEVSMTKEFPVLAENEEDANRIARSSANDIIDDAWKDEYDVYCLRKVEDYKDLPLYLKHDIPYGDDELVDERDCTNILPKYWLILLKKC